MVMDMWILKKTAIAGLLCNIDVPFSKLNMIAM